jgi:hypothetical protein
MRWRLALARVEDAAFRVAIVGAAVAAAVLAWTV